MTTMPSVRRTPQRLTLLSDDGCYLCSVLRVGLRAHRPIIPLDIVSIGSDLARNRYPKLDQERAREYLTVIDDAGYVYEGDAAWAMCAWVLPHLREMVLTDGVRNGMFRAATHVLGAAREILPRRDRRSRAVPTAPVPFPPPPSPPAPFPPAPLPAAATGAAGRALLAADVVRFAIESAATATASAHTSTDGPPAYRVGNVAVPVTVPVADSFEATAEGSKRAEACVDGSCPIGFPEGFGRAG